MTLAQITVWFNDYEQYVTEKTVNIRHDYNHLNECIHSLSECDKKHYQDALDLLLAKEQFYVNLIIEAAQACRKIFYLLQDDDTENNPEFNKAWTEFYTSHQQQK
jgi:hypothetical protein